MDDVVDSGKETTLFDVPLVGSKRVMAPYPSL